MTSIQPKNHFLTNPKLADEHQEAVLYPHFREAIQIALLEYQIRLRGDLQPAVVGLKLEGAAAVLEILLNLGEKPKSIHQPMPDELKPV